MSVTTKYRAAHATVHTKSGKDKFPIGDKKHARLAIEFEGRAKPPLTPAQRQHVEHEAAHFGEGPLAKKSTKLSTKPSSK